MDNEFNILLIKYITGEASADEAAEVKHWISQSPENEACYIELYETWHDTLYASPDLIDANSAFEKIIAGRSVPDKEVTDKRVETRNWFRVPLAAIILLAGIWGIYRYLPVFHTGSGEWNTVSVPHGEKKKVVLPDGSLVWINAGSSIRYRKDFGKRDRTIRLNGEAYFDIAAAKKDVPFIVQTEQFEIHDIGTKFNVKAYAGEDDFETAVFEGKVSVEGRFTGSSEENSRVFLNEKQALKIKAPVKTEVRPSKKDRSALRPVQTTELIKVIEFSPSQMSEYNGWKDDLLVFDGDSFDEIAKVLERRYNVKIYFKDEELKEYRYTGNFSHTGSVTEVLNIIRETTPINYRLDNQTVTVSKN